MSINYSLYPIPAPRGKEDEQRQYWGARIKSAGTKNTKNICQIISASTTFNPGEIKGMLDALNQWIVIWMSEGYNINLEGIGTLSVSLKSENVMEAKGYGLVTRIDGINFLPGTELKEATKKFELKHIKRTQHETFSIDERKERIMDYILRNNSISSSTCIRHNHCSKQRALQDLKEMVEEGKLLQVGNARTVMYIRSYQISKDIL